MECFTKRVHARMHRKQILEPISISLGINPKHFKNKQLLVNEIVRTRLLRRATRCYNEVDPCTMDPLDDIHDDFYIEWSQYNHRFGADARSIQQLLDSNNPILPWSIDFSTGIQASIDHQTYIERFDMTLVPGFEALVKSMCKTSTTNVPAEQHNIRNHFLFELERILGDEGRYAYGVVLNKIINNKSVRKIYNVVSENMYKVMFLLRNDSANRLHFDVFYQYCYIWYTSQAFHIMDKQEHLAFLLHTLKMFHELIGDAASCILQMVFMDM
jgi:hypothetical protein